MRGLRAWTWAGALAALAAPMAAAVPFVVELTIPGAGGYLYLSGRVSRARRSRRRRSSCAPWISEGAGAMGEIGCVLE